MKERLENVLEKLDRLDEEISSLQNKLAGEVTPYEAREILSQELTNLTKKKVNSMGELIEAIETVELILKNL